jgi:hypothetical protein
MENKENTLLERVSQMPMYKEKHKLRMFTEKEAEIIEKKKAEKIAKKMLLDNEPIEKIIKYTELDEKKILSIKKRLKIQ